MEYLLCEDEDKVWSTVEDAHTQVRHTQTGENIVGNSPHLGMTCSTYFTFQNHTFKEKLNRFTDYNPD